MDTKSKKSRCAVSFLAFFLGASLLLTGAVALAAALCSVGWRDLRDAFQGDYQNTAQFRQRMALLLDELATRASAMDGSGGAAAQTEDAPQNLLYAVRRGSQMLLSNTESPPPTDAPPDGYNFLLYFDGEKVSICKDGEGVDVYGDGYYRDGSDWNVPGYTNYPASPDWSDLTVTIAAVEEPVTYFNSGARYDRLPELVRRLERLRAMVLLLVVLPLAAGAAFFLWYVLWRKYKALADRAIAGVTAHIWLELKLLLLIPLALLCASSATILVELILYARISGSTLYCFFPPAALWWAYLVVNDLRYNGVHPHHSLCSACVRLFRAGELNYPIQRRLFRRSNWQFAATLPFIAASILLALFLYAEFLYQGMGPVILALLCLAGLALIALHVLFLKRGHQTAAELGALLDRIYAARDGSLNGALPLPADSDLHQAAEALDGIEAGLRAALEEQTRSERMKVELIANVSHDLKTPLTSIISYAELLGQEENLPEHVQDYVRILNAKSLRLKSMVQEVFEVSKAASGNLPVRLEALDLSKLLRQTLADMTEAIEQSTLTLRTHLPEEPVYIRADGDRLYRVFQNLIQNALQYALEGSRVHLTLRREGQSAVASVQNTSRDELPADVDFTARFVRGDASRSDGGSGLGLSIARTFTEACGGAFQVEVNADLFTAVVSFPLTQERPEA